MALAENALAAVGVSVQFGTVRGTTDRSIFGREIFRLFASDSEMN